MLSVFNFDDASIFAIRRNIYLISFALCLLSYTGATLQFSDMGILNIRRSPSESTIYWFLGLLNCFFCLQLLFMLTWEPTLTTNRLEVERVGVGKTGVGSLSDLIAEIKAQIVALLAVQSQAQVNAKALANVTVPDFEPLITAHQAVIEEMSLAIVDFTKFTRLQRLALAKELRSSRDLDLLSQEDPEGVGRARNMRRDSLDNEVSRNTQRLEEARMGIHQFQVPNSNSLAAAVLRLRSQIDSSADATSSLAASIETAKARITSVIDKFTGDTSLEALRRKRHHIFWSYFVPLLVATASIIYTLCRTMYETNIPVG